MSAVKERTAQISPASPNGAADPNAPSANSLAEILTFDTVPRTKFWHSRWKRWVHLRAMDAGSRRDWLERALPSEDGGKEHKYAQAMAISECWETEDGELIAVGDEGVAALNRLPIPSFDELWDNVARVNLLREKDREALKNDSGGTSGSATSPA